MLECEISESLILIWDSFDFGGFFEFCLLRMHLGFKEIATWSIRSILMLFSLLSFATLEYFISECTMTGGCTEAEILYPNAFILICVLSRYDVVNLWPARLKIWGAQVVKSTGSVCLFAIGSWFWYKYEDAGFCLLRRLKRSWRWGEATIVGLWRDWTTLLLQLLWSTVVCNAIC